VTAPGGGAATPQTDWTVIDRTQNISVGFDETHLIHHINPDRTHQLTKYYSTILKDGA